MTQILEQPDRDFKTTIIHMLKALTKKVDNSHEQMGNFSRKMETLRKSQMEMLEIKTHAHQKHDIRGEEFF